MPCSAVNISSVHCSALQNGAVHCSAVQCSAVYCGLGCENSDLAIQKAKVEMSEGQEGQTCLTVSIGQYGGTQ